MTRDEQWIHDHFEELVDKYAGLYVAVANEELVSIGESAGEVEEIAERKYPDIVPSVLRVPHEQDFECLL